MKHITQSRLSSAFVAAFFLLLATLIGLHAENGLHREVWTNLSSQTEQALAKDAAFFSAPFRLTTSPGFYAPPTTTDIFLSAVSQTYFGSPGKSYGARLRGYLTAPTTGDYTFWDAGPDTVAIYLSVDENPNGKRLLVSHRSYLADQEYISRGPLKSGPVRLVEGRKYYMEVIHTSDDGRDNLSLRWEAPNDVRVYLPIGALEPYTPPAPNPPGLTREFFPEIMGTGLDDLTGSPAFYRMPAKTDIITSAAYTDFARNYGVRLRGYLTAPATGEYIFWECGSGSVSLNLATDENSTALHQSVRLNDRPNKRELAHHKGELKRFDWTQFKNQQSKPVRLIAGKKYYIEILFKSGEEPDHLSIFWQTPKGQPESIPLSALESYRRATTDLDDDGMPDALERTFKLDPADAADAAGDLDEDGIFNDEEIRAGANPAVKDSVAGLVVDDHWRNVASLKLDEKAHQTASTKPVNARLASASMLIHGGGDGIRRVRGYITAPASGTYSFWAGSTGECSFSLSSSASNFELNPLIHTTFGKYGRLDTDPITQKSPPVILVGGQKYYFELWHTQGLFHPVVHVGWEIPGEPRQTIPSRYLSSYPGNPNDMDDDNLPDDWEKENGLSTEKNDAYADLDRDGLTNLEEYRLGTRPDMMDSDKDGVSDYEEVRIYHSNPVRKDALPAVKLANIALDTFRAPAGSWFESPSGSLISMERRGTTDFTFAVRTSGIYLIELRAEAHASGAYVPAIPIIARVNGSEIGRADVGAGVSTHRWLTSWLAAGSHTVTIDNRNVRTGLALEITSLAVYQNEGLDEDGNWIADWMDDILKTENKMDVIPGESPTSPVCIEGISRLAGDAVISSPSGEIKTQPGLAGHWFANVPLDPDGETKITGLFESGAVREAHAINWTATNLYGAPDTIRVRVGDSLKFTAVRPGREAKMTTTLYSRNDEQIGESQSGKPFIVKFDKAGTFTIAAKAVAANSADRSPAAKAAPDISIQIEVLEADFGPAFSLATGLSRVWDLPKVPHSLVIQADPELRLKEMDRVSPLSRRFTASYPGTQAGAPRVVARLWDDGPIVASASINAFWFVPASVTGNHQVLQTLPDGTRVVEVRYVLDGPIPADLSIWIQLKVTDALFANGSALYELTAADFNANGEARLLIYKAPGNGIPYVCHWIRPYMKDSFND